MTLTVIFHERASVTSPVSADWGYVFLPHGLLNLCHRTRLKSGTQDSQDVVKDEHIQNSIHVAEHEGERLATCGCRVSGCLQELTDRVRNDTKHESYVDKSAMGELERI